MSLPSVSDNSRITPPILEKEVGEEAEFICDSYKEPYWYINDLQSEPSISPFVQIGNLKPSNSGYYYCLGTYEAGSVLFLATAELLVYGKFKIVIVH